MNITSAQYKVDLDGVTKTTIKATIDGKVYDVPLEPANRHYAAILEWAKKAANEIQEAE